MVTGNLMLWIALIVVFLVLVMAVVACRRVNIPRRASTEGVENDEVIEAYDRISRWPQFRFLRNTVTTELKKHYPKGILADIGCGPGYLIADMAKSFSHLSIIGADISEEMLQKASQNLTSKGLADKVSFRQGDIQKLPFASDSLDFVVSTLSLHHWSLPGQAIQEIYRVLKPGGQFLIFDVRRDSPRLTYWVIRFAQSLILPPVLRRINEPTGSFLAGYTPAEVKEILATTPFQQWGTRPGFFWLFIWGRKG